MAHKGPTEHRYVAAQVRDWEDHARQLGRVPPHPHTLLLWLRLGPLTTRVPGLVLGGRAAMAEALRWSPKDFNRCFAALTEKGLAVADWDAPAVYLPWVLLQDCARPTSTAVVVGWRKVLADAPACELIERVSADVRRILTPAFLESFTAGRRVDGPPAGQPAPLTPPLADGLAAHSPAPLPSGPAGGLHEHEHEHEHPPGGAPPARSPGPVPAGAPEAAPQAWRTLVQEAGDRLPTGRAFDSATGLPHSQEREWLAAWSAARAVYSLDDLRKLGRALRGRVLWDLARPISAGELIKRLPDLLAEAVAWDEAAPRAPGDARPSQAASPDSVARMQQILRHGTAPRDPDTTEGG